MEKDLGSCTYCLRKGRKKNLARLRINDEDVTRDYCPDCLPEVLKGVKGFPWYEKHTIDYPYK